METHTDPQTHIHIHIMTDSRDTHTESHKHTVTDNPYNSLHSFIPSFIHSINSHPDYGPSFVRSGESEEEMPRSLPSQSPPSADRCSLLSPYDTVREVLSLVSSLVLVGFGGEARRDQKRIPAGASQANRGEDEDKYSRWVEEHVQRPQGRNELGEFEEQEDGRWDGEERRGQETMKSAGARALSKQVGAPGGLRTKTKTETDAHILTHNSPADTHPFICPVKTHPFMAAKFDSYTFHCFPPFFHHTLAQQRV